MACTAQEIIDLEADIVKVRSAKLQLATGKMVQSLTIGSDDLQRRYSYQEVNMAMLDSLLRELNNDLAKCNGDEEALSDFTTKIRTHAVRINTGRNC